MSSGTAPTVCPHCGVPVTTPAGRKLRCTECGKVGRAKPLTEQEAAGLKLRPTARKSAVHRVVITSVDIPFGNLVWLLLKLAIAGVLAAVVFWLIWTLVGVGVLGALLGGAN